mgnify:CR=1 FL=1
MSMTATLNEAGLVALPEPVLTMFGIKGARQIEIDVQDDGVMLRLSPSFSQADKQVTEATIEYRDGVPYIVDSPALSDADIVKAIRESRDEHA